MTVQELIDLLKTKDPSLRVVLNGYEGGFSHIEALKKLSLKLNVNEEDFYGPHEEVESDQDESAILIYKKNNPLSN